MVCDADSHYMLNAIPYLGKGTVSLQKPQTLGEYFTTALTQEYGRRGRTVTTDNWFTSLPLALSLRNNGLELVGTIRDKPYIPRELQSMPLDIGESVALFNYSAKVTVVCHRANQHKRVKLISTVHHKPTVIENKKTDVQMFYNATKGGVDSFDQMCSTHSCSRKTQRWPLCLFYGMLNIVMVNSYILYSSKTPSPKARRHFDIEMAESLCRPWATKRLHDSHLPRQLRTIIESTLGVLVENQACSPGTMKTEKRRRCYICPSSSNTRTRLVCRSCGRSVCQVHGHLTCTGCNA